MFERRLRLYLAGIMLVTLFLPMLPFPSMAPNLLFILVYSVEALSAIISGGISSVTSLILWFCILSFLWVVPLLFLLNICLVVRPFREIKVFYRASILTLLPMIWYGTFQSDLQWWGVGSYAILVVVNVAAILEIVLLIRERLGKPRRARPKSTRRSSSHR